MNMVAKNRHKSSAKKTLMYKFFREILLHYRPIRLLCNFKLKLPKFSLSLSLSAPIVLYRVVLERKIVFFSIMRLIFYRKIDILKHSLIMRFMDYFFLLKMFTIWPFLSLIFCVIIILSIHNWYFECLLLA